MRYHHALLLFAAAFVVGCEGEETISAEPPEARAGRVVAALNQVERQVADANIDRVTATEETVERDDPSDPQGGRVRLRKYERELADAYASLYINRPDFRNLAYPGSLLWWDALRNANFDPVTAAPGRTYRVVIHGGTTAEGEEVTSSFETDGSASDFGEKLSRVKLDSPSLILDHRVMTARSLEEAAMKLGFSASFLSFGEAEASSAEGSVAEGSVAVVALTQVYYSLGLDEARLPLGGPLALRDVTADEEAALLDELDRRKDEIVYVSDVNYGRVVLLMLSSTASQSQTERAAGVSGGYLGFSAGADVSQEDRQVLEQANARCIIIGGDPANPALQGVITGSFKDVAEKLKAYLATSLAPESPAEALPVSLTLRFARDKATAMVGDSTRYAYWVPFEKVWDEKPLPFDSGLISLPPPARVTRDTEMDTGDSGARVGVSYAAEVDDTGRGIKLTVDWFAHEYSNSFAKKKNTEISNSKTFEYANLVPPGFTLAPAGSTSGSGRHDFAQKNHDFIPFPDFAGASEVSVRYDQSGGNDHKAAELHLRVRVPFVINARIGPPTAAQ